MGSNRHKVVSAQDTIIDIAVKYSTCRLAWGSNDTVLSVLGITCRAVVLPSVKRCGTCTLRCSDVLLVWMFLFESIVLLFNSRAHSPPYERRASWQIVGTTDSSHFAKTKK